MIEEPLSGGNTSEVTRAGDTVRRNTGPWTAAVHTLLNSWSEAGIAETPRALGIDERGREVLTFIEGSVLAGAPPQILWSPEVLQAAGRLLRRMHDASVPLVGRDELVWRMHAHPPVEVICHNDVAPYNLVHRDGSLVGVIDADLASPGSRLWDLAYLAYRIAPLAEDAPAFDPDRFGQPHDRIRALVKAYGGSFTVAEVKAAVVQRLDELAQYTDARAADTGRSDFLDHAAMYRRDARALRAT